MKSSWLRLTLLLVILAPAVLGAQPPPVDEFVPMTSEELEAEQEQIPAPGLVFAAYGVVWFAFTFYALTLWRRIARVESELRAVTTRLEQQRR